MQAAIKKIAELDGNVSAIGLGGIDLYFYADGQRYVLRDALKMKRAAVKSPVVDGSGLKNTLERRAVEYLESEMGVNLKGVKVLMVAGVDRFGMAEAFDKAGADIIFGDLAFGLGIPIPIRGMRIFRPVAKALLPIVTLLPISVLYPTGKNQDKPPEPKYVNLYEEAEIVAGDFLFIHRHCPPRMDGKMILTNTVTAENVEDLRARGVKMLVTTTPEFAGRSFGTNVMEAMFLSLLGKGVDDVTEDDYTGLIDELQLKPRVVVFSE